MGKKSVFEQLRDGILTCELAPGLIVFEQELAQRFGLSKSPIRDALLRLQEQRLVEVRPRSGYRIRPISISEANELYEIRQMYEQTCLTRIVAHASDAQIESLAEHLTMDAHMDTRDWIALNRRFHSALADISGNALLADMANQLNGQIDRFTFVSLGRLSQPPNFDKLNKQHAAIVAALRARDRATALSVLRAHIEKSRQRTLQALSDAAVVP